MTAPATHGAPTPPTLTAETLAWVRLREAPQEANGG